jgi:hypothetical protein
LKAALSSRELAPRFHRVELAIEVLDEIEHALIGRRVRRQADAAEVGDLLELGRDRRLVGGV